MEKNLREALIGGRFQDVDRVVSIRNSRIKSKNTKPERALCSILRTIFGNEVEFEQHPEFEGSPDFFIPKFNLLIFVDGCFFHGCPKHGRIPSKNTEYWLRKIQNNKKRDSRKRAKLRRQGFRVWRIWEHDLSSKQRVASTSKKLSRQFTRLEQ